MNTPHFTRCIEQTARIAVLVLLAALAGCTATSLPERPTAAPGSATPEAENGTVSLRRIVAARWAVPLSGLLDLDHAHALEAGLEDRLEPIEIAVFLIEHPVHGRFLIDSGVAARFRDAPEDWGVAAPVRWFMGTDRLEVLRSTAEILDTLVGPLDGVFLTHLHLDHVMGMPDVPASVPVWIGPGEAAARSAEHLATRSTIDRMLGARGELGSWRFSAASAADDPARLDVFGDGSVIALHVPGHTPGSTAFLIRTEDGPQLVLGDASHTAWGWQHDVPPGSYTADAERGARSLQQLRTLAASMPDLRVHPGHQTLDSSALAEPAVRDRVDLASSALEVLPREP